MDITLYNSFSRSKEKFIPLNKDLIKMYVCGPTVYDNAHIGNARSVVVYDLLYRILTHVYGQEKVLFVRNITDVDDKIIERAASSGISINELTIATTKKFHEHMEYLNCHSPNIEPKATEHVEEMIMIINRLLDKNFAYEASGHVFFDISKVNNYMELSGRKRDELMDGIRIDIDGNKKHPGDFVLWKPAGENDLEGANFKSPFGLGRPGWHIECSAMSHKYLGTDFDIHGGGVDLIFPHHTNEIAQSTCAFPNSKYANFWVHNGFLTVNNEKMSKSLGNFITVADLIEKKIHGDIIRLFLLSSHYHKPLDYNDKAIQDITKLLNYWYNSIEDTLPAPADPVNLPTDFMESLLDDMNTTLAIKIINDYAKKAHNLTNIEDKRKYSAAVLKCANFLGVMNSSQAEWFHYGIEDRGKINLLINQRKEAKLNKKWRLADSIREDLLHMGIQIEDKPGSVTTWRKMEAE